jgi:hypothetical protein
MIIRENRTERTSAYSSAIVAWWNNWNNNLRLSKEPLHTNDLPHTQGRFPTPWFTDFPNTGLTESDLAEDAIEAIRDWRHVVAFVWNDPPPSTILVRPDEKLVAYMFTQYMYETWAWKIMPWIWPEMPNHARFFVRQCWKDFTSAGATMNDVERAELQGELEYLIKTLGNTPRPENIEAYTTTKAKAKAKLDLKRHMRKEQIQMKLYEYRNAFAGLKSLANLREITSGNQEEIRIAWNSRCDEVLLTAQIAAAPPRPSTAPVRTGRQRKPSAAARNRR